MPAPVHERLQHALRIFIRQAKGERLEHDLVVDAVVLGASDQREHVVEDAQRANALPEHGLAIRHRRREEALALGREHDVLLGRVDEVEQLGGLGHGEHAAELLTDVIDEVEDVGGSAVVVEDLEEADHLARTGVGQRLPRGGLGRCGHRRLDVGQLGLGDDRVNLVDQALEFLVAVVARIRQLVFDHAPDPSGLRGHDHDARRHEYDLFDVVTDHQDRLEVRIRRVPEPHDLAAQVLGGERIDLAERLVHAQDLRRDRERARDADALLHAAGQLARIRVLEPGEPDQVHDVLDLRASRRGVEAPRAQRLADVVGDGEPRVQREALEHDRDSRVEPDERRAAVAHDTRVRSDQPGEHAHERRLAAARRPEQREDLVLADRDRHVVQHGHRRAARQVEGLVDVLQLAE